MKRTFVLAALVLFGCNSTTASSSANLLGTYDLLFIDQLGDNGELAKLAVDADGNTTLTGVPGRYLFVTSSDTNELRVLELYRPNTSGRDFMRGPNPLETLSIPVLDRPTMLATAEGRNSIGQRVSSQMVFAARSGSSEVSIVSLARRAQLGGRPVPTPAPVVAIGGGMTVTTDDGLPDTSTLYVATWDGADSAIFTAPVAKDPSTVGQAIANGTYAFTRLTTVEKQPIAALLVVTPVPTRTLDGAAFCATENCLAFSTRPVGGLPGKAWLFEPSTRRSVVLGFPGPVQKFAAGERTGRLYALLDETSCGGACGGVVAVDLVTATTLDGFPRAKNVVGADFGPLRLTDALMTGLAIGQSAVIQQVTEVNDGGAAAASYLVQRYDELGAFASSEGYITFFSGASGGLIDYDGRRTTVSGVAARVPGVLPDGGASLSTEDGGVGGVLITGTVDSPTVLSETFRLSTLSIPTDPAQEWHVDISDGYMVTQDISVVFQSLIPGLVNLPASAATGTSVAGQGAEVRALSGDTVIFSTGDSTNGFVDCGRAKVTAIANGLLTVDQIPAGCEARTAFSVRAGTDHPFVVVGSNEGYMGRAKEGEAFTYNRPLVVIPADVIASRAALTIDVPQTGFTLEGSYITFVIAGHLTPLRVQIDTSAQGLTNCSSGLAAGQVVFGNLAMRPSATGNGQTAVTFPWETWGTVPSGNAIVEIQNQSVQAGLALTGSQAYCRR